MRVIETGLNSFDKGEEILRNVLAQMSDGIWENSSRIIGYWACANVNDDGNLCVTNFSDSYYNCKSPYRKMNDKSIRLYFANKIKQVVRIELQDNYTREIRRRIYSKYKLKDTVLILCSQADEYKRADNEINDYLEEHPFLFKGIFNDRNDTELAYLSDSFDNDAMISVGDAYEAYKIMVAV